MRGLLIEPEEIEARIKGSRRIAAAGNAPAQIVGDHRAFPALELGTLRDIERFVEKAALADDAGFALHPGLGRGTARRRKALSDPTDDRL